MIDDDLTRLWKAHDLCRSEDAIFAASGVCDGYLPAAELGENYSVAHSVIDVQGKTVERISTRRPCDCMSQHVRIKFASPRDTGRVTFTFTPIPRLRIEETMPLGKGRGTATLSSDDVELALEAHPGIDEVRSLGNQRFAVDIASGGGGFIRPLRVVGVVPGLRLKSTMDGLTGPLFVHLSKPDNCCRR